jgi:hypothetical protein
MPLAALLLAAAAEAGAEASKTPYYVAGSLLVLFALLLGALGIVRDDFPSSRGVTFAVLGIAAALVAATMASAVLTG